MSCTKISPMRRLMNSDDAHYVTSKNESHQTSYHDLYIHIIFPCVIWSLRAHHSLWESKAESHKCTGSPFRSLSSHSRSGRRSNRGITSEFWSFKGCFDYFWYLCLGFIPPVYKTCNGSFVILVGRAHGSRNLTFFVSEYISFSF